MSSSVLHPARALRPRLTVRGLLEALAQADARYRANAHFQRLDDHLLRDIGVSRGDLAAELRGLRVR